MRRSSLGVVLLSVVLLAGTPVVSGSSAQESSDGVASRLMVTNSMAQHVSIIDTSSLEIQQIDVGPAPWGIALTGDGRAWVSTATGIAAVDISSRSVIATVSYLTTLGPVSYGEYREGGMGIVASPDGRFVYVGVNVNGLPGWLEVIDTELLEVVDRVQVGVRPFDVVISPDGSTVYSIDHDSFTITAVNTSTLGTETIEIAPLGYGGFDKPHYGKVLTDGSILLPYQGQVLLRLDPATGDQSFAPLTANSHMHGISTNSDESCAAIVGTGAAGGATGPPSLTLLDLASGLESVFPMDRPHEMAAIDNTCSTAWVTGGYTYADGGWDGVSIVDLQTGAITEMAVPGKPLWIVWLD